MQDNIELLDIMLKDQRNQTGIYRAGPYWKSYVFRVAKAIYADGLKDFRSNSRIGKGYVDTVPIDPADLLTLDSWKSRFYKTITKIPLFKKYVIDLYINNTRWHFLRAQKYRDLYYTNTLTDWFNQFKKKYHLPDTLVGSPQDVVSINEYKIGRSYLDVFLRLHNYSKLVDFNSIETVFEIGGGFGTWAHVLLHCFPNIKKYLYLDIPPILYVGTQYLKHFYGNEVISYRETRNSKRIGFSPNRQREILAVCPWQIKNIDAKIDIFFNSSSFQEMTEDIVANYAHHINRMFDERSIMCLYIYKGGNPKNTLLPERICKLIENDISVRFEELKPEIEIYDAHYFLGKKKV